MRRRKRISDVKNIGFISTRIAGTDGVSLEAGKWVEVLEDMGYTCFYFAGKLDTPPERSLFSPKAHFTHPEIDAINEFAYNNLTRSEDITDRIERIKRELIYDIKRFIRTFDIDLIIVENAFAIPINIPLGVALVEFVAETGMPTVSHNHDFYWERKRFSVNCVWDYLNKAFPPRHPFIRHVVINSEARNQIALRRGAAAIIIPNVMNFAKPPPPPDDYTLNVKKDLGITDNEYFILQPTRVVQRKGIEHAIELVNRLGRKRVKSKLVISHASGDEGDEYERRVREYSKLMRVNTMFGSSLINDERGSTKNGKKIYRLSDVYPHVDLVTYPSAYEGFGNAFLEAIYFKKPILVNTYSIYLHDIKPKGFKVIEMDDYMNEKTVNDVIEILQDKNKIQDMVNHNYNIAKRFYSYANLRRKLRFILTDFFGED
ncbi:MAG: glycosyltransferase family 4 protein [Desulfobacteraceae bacterium]|nr:glycosyltransferase family 4 protein [Desulfobacteraceae bacterium]